jgi:hypothetical protein
VAIITGWLDKLDAATLSTADGFAAFKLLASLENRAVLRAKRVLAMRPGLRRKR